MKCLLTDKFGYHGSLKRYIQAVSYCHILFHKKVDINGAIAELDMNSLLAIVMTVIKIINGKTKRFI
jgi:hypothetical protein